MMQVETIHDPRTAETRIAVTGLSGKNHLVLTIPAARELYTKLTTVLQDVILGDGKGAADAKG